MYFGDKKDIHIFFEVASLFNEVSDHQEIGACGVDN